MKHCRDDGRYKDGIRIISRVPREQLCLVSVCFLFVLINCCVSAHLQVSGLQLRCQCLCCGLLKVMSADCTHRCCFACSGTAQCMQRS